jgi:hypothetical protein
MNWYDKACEQLDNDYDNGLMDSKDYQAAMRDLNAEYEDCRQNAAREAYENY